MKKIISILLLVALMSVLAISAVACAPREITGAITNEKATQLLFGYDQAFALMDKVANFKVEYTATSPNGKTAGTASLVLDETNGENFVSVYANSTYKEGVEVSNSTSFMFYTWAENRKGELEKTLVNATSFTGEEVIEPHWTEYSQFELDSDDNASLKQQHNSLIANCGAHTGTRYIREEIYNQNKDVFDTVQLTGTGRFKDESMTDVFGADVVITYNYEEDGKTIYGTATVVVEEMSVKLVDGKTVTGMVIKSITIAEEGGLNFSVTYTYGVDAIPTITKDNYKAEWPEAYPLA